ncbi:uncharacterized protein [Clytia hemisphaerica]|uniref:Chitin-binding type-2 domain-containing protein n=1 Tax=Clytia hemisphaerica TaxID=252671 RepID=A0A7M5X2S2_9CNID|eukprot:TCONS_00034964-protein
MGFILTCALLIVVIGAAKTSDGDDSLTYKNCRDSLCARRADGNYGIKDAPNHFVSCVNKKAYCQHCWPSTLVYKEECNQCTYTLKDECQTTHAIVAPPRREGDKEIICPDICVKKGPKFDGNIANPNYKGHYVACWKGMTVGCIDCPGDLLFNEKEQACLYDGKFMTEPMKN